MPVHKARRVRGSLLQAAWPSSALLPGRLASGGRAPGPAVSSAAFSAADSAGPGLSSVLGEVGSRCCRPCTRGWALFTWLRGHYQEGWHAGGPFRPRRQQPPRIHTRDILFPPCRILPRCDLHGVDPRSAPINRLAAFLMPPFDKGHWYSLFLDTALLFAAFHMGFLSMALACPRPRVG